MTATCGIPEKAVPEKMSTQKGGEGWQPVEIKAHT